MCSDLVNLYLKPCQLVPLYKHRGMEILANISLCLCVGFYHLRILTYGKRQLSYTFAGKGGGSVD